MTDKAEHTDSGQHGYSEQKAAYLRRLKRIEGQVRGISRMVDEDKYCIDILTQVSAINSALHAVSVGLLEEHIAHCVVDAAKTSDEAAREKVAEASAAISRLVRS
ncbi:metal-sensitive transcriptional regulator [Saxibacter everestensis]|uniref:Metal-sensitive transcriptional regulator n=1 Tax=Saxibacter everestensis TaxID=2909229 RepID=A0ABY8QUM5_9MICO|nr:metal-sensitive transcriptional regulator [Brevibacteriaceae bacterium ZFBP1038]